MLLLEACRIHRYIEVIFVRYVKFLGDVNDPV